MKIERIKYSINILSGLLVSLLLVSCGDDGATPTIDDNKKTAVETLENKFVSQHPWDSDKNAALEKLKENYEFYSELSPTLQKDMVIIDAALKNEMPLYMLDDSLSKNKEAILIGLKYDPDEFYRIDESLKSDPDIILASLKSSYSGALKGLKQAPDKLKSDPDFMLKVLKIRSDSQEIQSDYGLEKPVLYPFVVDSLKSNKSFIEKAVPIVGSILCDLDDAYKNNRALALKAVKQYGSTFACLSEALRKDRDLALAAIKQNGSVLLMGIDPKFRDDKALVLAAINQAGPHVIAGISQRLQKDKDVLKLIKEKMAQQR